MEKTLTARSNKRVSKNVGVVGRSTNNYIKNQRAGITSKNTDPIASMGIRQTNNTEI